MKKVGFNFLNLARKKGLIRLISEPTCLYRQVGVGSCPTFNYIYTVRLGERFVQGGMTKGFRVLLAKIRACAIESRY